MVCATCQAYRNRCSGPVITEMNPAEVAPSAVQCPALQFHLAVFGLIQGPNLVFDLVNFGFLYGNENN